MKVIELFYSRNEMKSWEKLLHLLNLIRTRSKIMLSSKLFSRGKREAANDFFG